MNTLKSASLMAFFILGIILFILNRQIDKFYDGKTMPVDVKNSNTGVLIISVALILLPLSMLQCEMTCDGTVKSLTNNLIYGVIVAAIGLTLIVLGSIIHSRDKEVGSRAMIVWLIGLGVFLLSGVFFWSSYQNKVAQA